VVTVAVDPGGREDLGEAVQELEGGEAKCRAAGGIGVGEEIEDLVGAAADEVESLQREGGSGAVPDKAFEAGAVGGLDADAGVQAEPAAVIPGQHVLGLVGLQEAVAGHVAENPPSDRVLEALQELGGEGGGFVEAKVGVRAGGGGVCVLRGGLNLLEEPVHDAKVIVEPSGRWGSARSAPRRLSARPSNKAKRSSMN
jgi:hypothetical protein